MDLKTQKKTLELLYKLLDGTNGIVPFVEYSPQKQVILNESQTGMEKHMDLKTQKKTLELLYKLLDGTNGIVPFVEYSPQKQVFPDKEEKQRLKRAIPETQGISSVYLKTFLEELVSREKKIHGIMVIRNGCVLAETFLLHIR